jgi:hypothetical protein
VLESVPYDEFEHARTTALQPPAGADKTITARAAGSPPIPRNACCRRERQFWQRRRLDCFAERHQVW